MLSLGEHMRFEVDGNTFRGNSVYKVTPGTLVTGKLVPDQGYKLPASISLYDGLMNMIPIGSSDYATDGTVSIPLYHSTSITAIAEEGGEEETPAEGEFVVDQLKYKITSVNTVTLLGPDVEYKEDWEARICEIPATVMNGRIAYKVTEIANEAFYGCEVLEEISIPVTVTKIGMGDDRNSGALVGIPSLKKIMVIGDNPNYTDQNGILYTKDMSTLLLCPAQLIYGTLTLPSSVKRIESEAFAYCVNIHELVMPEGLTHVMAGAFGSNGGENVQWKSFRFPSTIQFLDDMLFDDLDRGLEIHCASTNPSGIIMEEGVFTDVDTASVLYVPKGTKGLYDSLPQWNEFKKIIEEGEPEEPAATTFTVEQLKYTVIGKNEVAISGVTDKTPNYYDIKQTVTYENVVYKVTTVGKQAFKDCTNLTRFNPYSISMVIDSIGDEAFQGCTKLSDMIFAEGLKHIGDYAFERCSSLITIEIPASVIHIGDGVFEQCTSLAQIRVRTGNANYASSNSVLYDKAIKTLLVYPCKHGSIYTVPSTVTRIADYAFFLCEELKTLTLPEGLVEIGTGAFHTTGLKSLTLPSSLKQVGWGIIGSGMEELHCKSTTPPTVKAETGLGSTIFYHPDVANNCTLYVPKGSKTAYIKATGWNLCKRIVEEGSDVEDGEEKEPLVPDASDNKEITLGSDSTYTDANGNTGSFNGMIGDGTSETVIDKLTIDNTTHTTITLIAVTVGTGGTIGTTTNITANSQVTIELVGDNSLGNLVNNGIITLLPVNNGSKLHNTLIRNNGTFTSETSLVRKVEGNAPLDVTDPSNTRVKKDSTITLTASTVIGSNYNLTFTWERWENGVWKAIGTPRKYSSTTTRASGLRTTAERKQEDVLSVPSSEAGTYRCTINNMVGNVSTTLTTSEATVELDNDGTTANDDISQAVKVWSSGGTTLHVYTTEKALIRLISFNGQIIKTVEESGEVQFSGLLKGHYIVEIGRRIFKIAL